LYEGKEKTTYEKAEAAKKERGKGVSLT